MMMAILATLMMAILAMLMMMLMIAHEESMG